VREKCLLQFQHTRYNECVGILADGPHFVRSRPQVYETPVKSGRGRGCITSTPKSADFSHFWQKRPKNERSFCIPWPKNAERPYLASWKHGQEEGIFAWF